MRNHFTTWCLIIISLTIMAACKRTSFDEEKQALVGKCPHLEFFQSSGPRADSYLLEARYLECQLLLDSSSLAYGTEEMKRVIEQRKWRTLDGFAACLENIREFGMFEDPKEPYATRLGACLHQVMVTTVKPVAENAGGGPDRQPEASPGKARAPVTSRDPSARLGRKPGQPTLGAGIPVDLMDWDAICRFTLDELAEPREGTPRVTPNQETPDLMSRECHRLAGKLRAAAVTDTGVRNMTLALFEGEKLTLFKQELDAAVAAAREGGRGASEDRGDSGGRSIDGGGAAGGSRFRIRGDTVRGGSIRQGAAQVTGKLDPNEVRMVIRAHRNEVHHCYQKGLLHNEKLAGTVRVAFLVQPDGRAQECRVEENLAVAEVGNCICGRLQTWRLPQPEGRQAKVVYSWTLKPGN